MVRSSYEKADNDGPGNGRSQMEGDDAERKGREYQEGDGSGENEAPGDAEGEAVGDRQESGRSPVGQIYFIETTDGQYVKIGYSKQIVVRLSQLGTLRPISFSLRILGSIPGSIALERWLHHCFHDEHDNGEWFRKSARLATFIETLALVPPILAERKQRPRKPREAHALRIVPEIAKTATGVEDPDEDQDAYIRRRLKEELEKLPKESDEGEDSEEGKNPAAVALGKRGAAQRMKKLTPEQRSEIARKAGLAGGRGRKRKEG